MKAYKYELNVMVDLRGIPTRRNTQRITEYYIPSLEICFNRVAVLKSQVARNSKSIISKACPLTATEIPDDLANDLKNILGDNDSAYFDKIKNDDILSIFEEKNIPGKTKITPSGSEKIISFVKDIDNFWNSYEAKGNVVLKKAIIYYILNGITPPDVELSQLQTLTKTLEEVEKVSLAESISAALDIKDGKLLRRNEDIESINASKAYCGKIGAGLGFFAARSVSVAPPVGAAAGAVLGYIGEFAYKEYSKYKTNSLWDEREKRADEFLKEISVFNEQSTSSMNMGSASNS